MAGHPQYHANSPSHVLRLDYPLPITAHRRGAAASSKNITDAGLKHLRGMADLRFLDLSQTQVTDAGLKHLIGLKKLEGLGVHDTKVTEEGIQELKQALPRLQLSET